MGEELLALITDLLGKTIYKTNLIPSRFSSRSLPVAWWQQRSAPMTSSVPKVVGVAAGAPVARADMVEAATEAAMAVVAS